MQPELTSQMPTAHLDAVANVIGTSTFKAMPISNGANNQVYKIETSSECFILKYYPDSPNDHRDRYKAETTALSFMNLANLTCVPSLAGCDHNHRLAIMSFVDGDTIETATNDHIHAALNFTQSLHKASKEISAHKIEAASEACLSPADVIKQISSRRNKLEETITKHPTLQLFLEQEFDVAFENFQQDAIRQLEMSEINPLTPLTSEQLTLSPSDFGFHNALDINGKIIFLDFEYFGWDDPVRLVSDFLIHPGHNLSVAQKELFARVTSEYFSKNDKSFLPRLKALYPLIGLRWCMILLNEFLPERLARRRAAGARDDAEAIYARQLGKSETLLTTILETKRVLPL